MYKNADPANQDSNLDYVDDERHEHSSEHFSSSEDHMTEMYPEPCHSCIHLQPLMGSYYQKHCVMYTCKHHPKHNMPCEDSDFNESSDSWDMMRQYQGHGRRPYYHYRPFRPYRPYPYYYHPYYDEPYYDEPYYYHPYFNPYIMVYPYVY